MKTCYYEFRLIDNKFSKTGELSLMHQLMYVGKKEPKTFSIFSLKCKTYNIHASHAFAHFLMLQPRTHLYSIGILHDR